LNSVPETSSPDKINLKLPIMILNPAILESDRESSLSYLNVNLKNSPFKVIASPNKNKAYIKKSMVKK
jgi:hypothetical protein